MESLPDKEIKRLRLPEVATDQLENLSIKFKICMRNSDLKDRLVTGLKKNEYLLRVIRQFRICEDNQDVNSLNKLHTCLKDLFFIDSYDLYEIMFQDNDLINYIVGCLEYCEGSRKHFRELMNRTNMKRVVDISQELESLFQKLQKIEFLLKVVLQSVGGFQKEPYELINFTDNLKEHIVKFIVNDENTVLEHVFNLIMSEDTSEIRKHELITFIDKFVGMTLYVTDDDDERQVIETISELGLFRALSSALKWTMLRSMALKVTNELLETTYGPSAITEFIMSEASNDFIKLILRDIYNNVDDQSSLENIETIVGIFERLLQTQNQDYLNILFGVTSDELLTKIHDIRQFHQGRIEGIMKLLSIAGVSHKMKDFVIANVDNVKDLITWVLEEQQIFSKIEALKIFKVILSFKDDTLRGTSLRLCVFNSIIHILIQNEGSDNIIVSNCLEIIEFLKEEDETFICECVTKHFGSLEKLNRYKPLRELFPKLGVDAKERRKSPSPLKRNFPQDNLDHHKKTNKRSFNQNNNSDEKLYKKPVKVDAFKKIKAENL